MVLEERVTQVGQQKVDIKKAFMFTGIVDKKNETI